jgi:predicted GIY-YIG superfamily endonuclease
MYCAYIMTNMKNGTLYVGSTNDLPRRVFEHKNKLVEGFTKKYDLTRLVYYECGESYEAAAQREKSIKKLEAIRLVPVVVSAGCVASFQKFCNVGRDFDFFYLIQI